MASGQRKSHITMITNYGLYHRIHASGTISRFWCNPPQKKMAVAVEMYMNKAIIVPSLTVSVEIWNIVQTAQDLIRYLFTPRSQREIVEAVVGPLHGLVLNVLNPPLSPRSVRERERCSFCWILSVCVCVCVCLSVRDLQVTVLHGSEQYCT